MKLSALVLGMLIVSNVALAETPDYQTKPLRLSGPYLGQKLPGDTPVVFAPGYVSREHRDNSGFFSPDLKTFYFTRKYKNSDKWSLVSFKVTENIWHESVVMERIGRPLISPDGQTMHLGNKYMTLNGEAAEPEWSTVKSLGKDFEQFRVMRLTSSLDGLYVLDEVGPGGTGLLRYSELVDGKRQTPKPFGKEINTGQWNAHPFLAADGSYLIWDGERESGQGDGDLYISFRLPNGKWSEALNMGDSINTEASESGAYVTPDGKYLFFNRNMNHPQNYDNIDIFWVSAKIINKLRESL
ncbi:hypothetical protein ACFSJY_10280 [Thalassotalea euphylliae]|uniref:hypothetical protein n=1 Tax=Thalassotalea euphylliae TaxID=1655234 RepID=UPI00362F824F